MSDVNCPICNALVALAPGLPAGHRATCPRCGEGFTLRQATTGTTDRPPASPPSSPSPDLRTANRRVALVVLGVMGLAATVGLVWALSTQAFRRANDLGLTKGPSRRPGLGPKPGEEEIRTPPADLPALRYLPPETSLFLGAHVAELQATPSTRALLKAGVPLGLVTFQPELLEGWTGLKVEDLDHAVLGVEAEDRILLPTVHLVARARRAIDQAKVRTTLAVKAPNKEPTPEGKTRDVYPFQAKVGERSLPLNLAFLDAHTMVVGMVSNLSSVPEKPHKGTDSFAPAVKHMLRDRIGPVGPVWLAGWSADWQKTPIPFLIAQAKVKDGIERLKQVRSFGLWVVPEPDGQLAVRAALQGVDARAAEALGTTMLAPLAPQLPGFRHSRDGDWLSAQWRTDGPGLRKLLGN